MKTRKILAMLMAILMLVGCMAACGGKTEDDSTTTTTAAPQGEEPNGGGEVDLSSPDEKPVVSVETQQKIDTAFDADFVAEWGPYLAEEYGSTINLTAWFPQKAQDVFKAEVAEFTELFKDYVTINVEFGVQEEGDTAKYVVNDPDKAADIFSFPSDQLNKLVNAETLLEVIFTDEVKGMNTTASTYAGTMNGKVYAYPETGDNSYCLVYDKRVVSEEDAKTLEGVLAACEKAGKKMIYNTGNGFMASTLVFTGGLETVGLEEDGLTQVLNDYDEKVLTETAMAFGNLFKQYKGTFENAQPVSFIDGVKVEPTRTAAGVIGSWDFGAVKKALGENAGFALLPTINVNGEDKPIINMFGYKYIGVNSKSKAPDAAQLLAYYLTGEKCQLDRAEKLDWGPSNVSAQEKIGDNESLKTILAQAKNSVPQVNIAQPFWTAVESLGTYVANSDNAFTYEEANEQVKACVSAILDE